MPELLNIADARIALGGVSRSTVYALLKANTLESRHVGARRMILRRSIDQIIAHGA